MPGEERALFNSNSENRSDGLCFEASPGKLARARRKLPGRRERNPKKKRRGEEARSARLDVEVRTREPRKMFNSAGKAPCRTSGIRAYRGVSGRRTRWQPLKNRWGATPHHQVKGRGSRSTSVATPHRSLGGKGRRHPQKGR